MNRTTRTTALALIGASALALSACGGGDAGGDTSAQTNAMYAWISNENDRAQWQAFVDAAKEKDPDFNLTLEGPTFADYWTKVKTRMSANDAPCIMTTQAARAQELESLLEPLDDLATKHGLDLGQYNQAMMEGMTVDGTVRAIPYDAEPNVLFYNKTAFAEAGLDEPTTSYTRDQFLSDAKALTGDGKYGISLLPGVISPMALAVAFAEGAAPTADGSLTLTDPTFMESVQWVMDLANVEKVSKPTGGAEEAATQQAFMSGEAAMVVDGPWMYTAYKEGLTEGELGVAVIPTTDGEAGSVIQGSGFGIAKTCEDKDGAFQNIMAITTPEVIGTVGRTRGTVPSIESVVADWAEDKTPGDLEAVKAMLAGGGPLVTTTSWNQVQTLSMQFGAEATNGQKSAEDILTQIQQSAQG
ncbi:ABC transporter substrate-binding protein [Tessaracoccus sp. G1721]